MDIKILEQKHKELFHSSPFITVRSPGRINFIGEHTDYNDGFVFPATIDKAIRFVASKNSKRLFRFFSYNFDAYFEMEVDSLSKSRVMWANYLLGVAAQFIKKGKRLEGVDVVFGGDIPIGAGLSSSAALETGFALVLNELSGFNTTRPEMVKMAQKAEHEYAGVMCGVMDQFVIMHGKKNCAIKLDCRSLNYKYAAVDLHEYQIVLCNTNVKHSLASSAYNQRRLECERGVEILKNINPQITALRDADITLLSRAEHKMSETVYRRCKYVIEENRRVAEAYDALNRNDIKHLGELMMLTHKGLRDDFEVSCKELDILFDFAEKFDGVAGARMMGGGFGGCTINLVEKSKINRFKKEIAGTCHKITGRQISIYDVEISDGTSLV